MHHVVGSSISHCMYELVFRIMAQMLVAGVFVKTTLNNLEKKLMTYHRVALCNNIPAPLYTYEY